MTTTSRLGRRACLAGLASASVGVVVGGTLATFSDTETDSGSLTSGKWSSCRAVYTDGGALTSSTQGAGETTYGVDAVDVLGPADPGFSGSEYHVPVVNGDGDLLLIAADGTGTAMGVDSKKTPRGSKAVLATAAWNGHPLSVYYPGSSESKLFRVAPGEQAKRVSKPSNGIKAALGAGDVNGDGTAEFCFVDGSATIRYIVPSGDNNERDIRSTGKSAGSNNNYGVGAPAAIDGYGVVVPAVNGSGGLGLLDADGWAEKSLTSGSTAKKTAVHACDFDDDGDTEIVFAGASNSYLEYLDDVGGTNDVVTVHDDAGDPIPVDTKRGVR